MQMNWNVDHNYQTCNNVTMSYLLWKLVLQHGSLGAIGLYHITYWNVAQNYQILKALTINGVAM